MIDLGPAKKKSNPDSSSDSSSESSSDSDSDSESDTEDKSKAALVLAAEEAKIKAMPGIPRPERRRLILIARQRYKIHKRLGLDPNSKETHPEAEEELAKWREKREEAHVKIDRKRQERNKKKAAKRIRKLVERKQKLKLKRKEGREKEAKASAE